MSGFSRTALVVRRRHMDIESALHSLPSMRSFLDRVANGARGRVTLALIPNIVSRDMVSRLILNRLSAVNLDARDLSRLGDGMPATAVADALGVSWRSPSAPRNAANLMRCEGMPRIVYARRVPNVGAERRGEWREFIEDWAREGRKTADEGETCPGLCVVAKLRDFDFDVPDPRAGLETLWWWGMSSELETRLACRVANLEYGGGDDSLAVWREHVVPALAAGDPQLAERMWERASDPLDDVMDALSEYADETGLADCEENVADAIRLIGEDARDCAVGEEPPESLRKLWASGGLALIQERGVEIHPALLARRGRRGDIANMLWRGQAEALLPTLNEIRLKICVDFTRTFGEDWPSKWWDNGLPKGGNLGAELSYICALFNFVGEGRGHSLNEKRHMYPLASLARDLRNKIAHNEPVSFADFSALLDERRKVGL